MALPSWLAEFYVPLDFLGILGFPNERFPLDSIGLFLGYHD
jgi:hypothetical protein